MKRRIALSQGIIGIYEVLILVDILPELKECFTQRKQYPEFYFTETWVELSLETLDRLSQEFGIVLQYDTLTINV